MTEQIANPFLEGHGVPVALADVEAELARLWGPAGVEAGGDEGEPAVTRVALANLIVECLDDPARVASVLETVMAHYPCRAIVLCSSDATDRRIEAEASALCHLPAPGLPQVCSERIVLRAGPSAHDLFPGAVRPLLEPDVPLILWWTSDPTTRPGLYRELAAECSRVIVDLPDPIAPTALALGLDRAVHPFSRDSAWFAITGWRELIAQLFDPACLAGALDQIAQVVVEVDASRLETPPRPGLWLVAWLAGQLGWKPTGRPTITPAEGSSRLDARFESASGPVEIALVARLSTTRLPDPVVAGVTITCRDPRGESILRLARQSPLAPAVRIDVTSPEACRLPRVVDSTDPKPEERIAAALASARLDPPFDRALTIATRLLGVETQ